jgi:hypothetical protein
MLPPSPAYTIQAPPSAERLEPATQPDKGQKALEKLCEQCVMSHACALSSCAVGESVRLSHPGAEHPEWARAWWDSNVVEPIRAASDR